MNMHKKFPLATLFLTLIISCTPILSMYEIKGKAPAYDEEEIATSNASTHDEENNNLFETTFATIIELPINSEEIFRNPPNIHLPSWRTIGSCLTFTGYASLALLAAGIIHGFSEEWAYLSICH